MRAPKKAEQDFIKANQKAFAAAHTAAVISIRSNSHFVGLEKIREPLALQAALKACGYADASAAFGVPPSAGEPTADVQGLVDAAYREAIDAARAAL